MKIGDRIPSFELQDQNGRLVRFDDVRGKGPIVLFFYPKDETPVCTAEACSFRDNYADFAAVGAVVIGVSSDDVASHKRFADRHQLPYTLLADVGGEVRTRLGVPKGMFGLMDGRVTYILDSDGVVVHVHHAALQAQAHVTRAMATVKRLSGPAAAPSA